MQLEISLAARRPDLSKDQAFMYKGRTFYVRIPLFLRTNMYPGFGSGLSVDISTEKNNSGLGSERIKVKGKDVSDVQTAEDLTVIAAGLMTPALVRKLDKGVAKRAELATEAEQLQEQWAEEDRKKDKSMKARGFKYRLNYVIHSDEGDDSMVIEYVSRKPTDASMRAKLRRAGSAVLDHYTITKL